MWKEKIITKSVAPPRTGLPAQHPAQGVRAKVQALEVAASKTQLAATVYKSVSSPGRVQLCAAH